MIYRLLYKYKQTGDRQMTDLYDEAVSMTGYGDTVEFLKRQGYTIKRNRESIIQIIPPDNLGLKTYNVTAIEVNTPEDIPEELREYLDFEDLKGGTIYNEVEVLTEAHEDFKERLLNVMRSLNS